MWPESCAPKQNDIQELEGVLNVVSGKANEEWKWEKQPFLNAAGVMRIHIKLGLRRQKKWLRM